MSTLPASACPRPVPLPPRLTTMLAPEHFAVYFAATALTRGASAVEPLAVMLPCTHVNVPGVPSVVGALLLLPDDEDEPDELLELPPQAEINRPIAIVASRQSATRQLFN